MTTARDRTASAAELLKALAHPARLSIVEALRGGERTVASLEADLGLRQPGLSQQLAALREAGLAVVRREAKSATYALAPAPVSLLADVLGPILAVPGPAAGPPSPARPARSRPLQASQFAVVGPAR